MSNSIILTKDEAKKLTGANIEIPEGYTEISPEAFSGRDDLKTIDIPGSVAVIGSGCFSNCSNLSHVGIPNGVKKIGSHAFEYCKSLVSVFMPKSIWLIGDNAFRGCLNLSWFLVDPGNTSYSDKDGVLFNKVQTILIKYPVEDTRKFYEIPKGVEKIEAGAFSSSVIDMAGWDKGGNMTKTKYVARPHLEGVVIPDGTIEILSDTFADQSRLKCVNLPDSVRYIKDRAFENCISLKSISIPDSVCDISETAFAGCDDLTVICSENSNAHIYARDKGLRLEVALDTTKPFELNSFTREDVKNANAEHIVIPDGHTHILDFYYDSNGGFREIFEDLKDLKSITIPKSLIGFGIFKAKPLSCESLADIHVAENNLAYSSIDGVLFNSAKTELIEYPRGKTQEHYVIPDGVVKIGCTAFYNCANLRGVCIPNSVRHIEPLAFSGCKNLTRIDFPEGVEKIGDQAFSDCENLTVVSIPKSVWQIDSNAFSECFNLTDFHVDAMNPSYSDEDGVLFNKVKTILLHYPKGKTQTSYVIPDGVETINDAFSVRVAYYGDDQEENSDFMQKRIVGKSNLESITIPDSVVSVCFEDCTNLTIRCREGSFAHKYAVEHGIRFEPTGKAPDITLDEMQDDDLWFR